MSNLSQLSSDAEDIAIQTLELSQKIAAIDVQAQAATGVDPFVFAMSIFVMACFVGYFVIWKVTPSLHTPLMAITNAISSIIIVGAILVVGIDGFGLSQSLGFVAVLLASINIFGGFVVTQRMLGMFKKKER